MLWLETLIIEGLRFVVGVNLVFTQGFETPSLGGPGFKI